MATVTGVPEVITKVSVVVSAPVCWFQFLLSGVELCSRSYYHRQMIMESTLE